MWSAGTKGLSLYVGTRRVVLARADEVLLNEPVQGWAEAIQRGSKGLHDLARRAPLTVWLSGSLCRPFLMPGSTTSMSADERQRVALSLAPRHSGMTDDCEVQIDAGRSDAGLAVAAAKEAIHGIRQTVGGVCRVKSIRPWWAAVLVSVLQRPVPPTALGVLDCDALTVLAGSGGAFTLAQTHAPADVDSAGPAWSRANLNDAVPEGGRVLISLATDGASNGVPAIPFGMLASEQTE